MAQKTHFPVEFLALHKDASGLTAPGVYLRWFIKPYLGLPGIYPLHPSGGHGPQLKDCGFRLFFSTEYNRQPELLPLDPALLFTEGLQDRVSGLITRPGWMVFFRRNDPHAEVKVDLRSLYGDGVCYMRFNYSLCRRQTMTLYYTIHNRTTGADTTHRVNIHYNPLITRLDHKEQEAMTYAIHVDETAEAIVALRLVSNRSIVLGRIEYALTEYQRFYIWSPARSKGIWNEVPSNAQLIKTLNSQLIQPGPHGAVVKTMIEFYNRYYGLKPHQVDGNQAVSFEFPDLSAIGLPKGPLREYMAHQYRVLCEGGYEPGPSEKHRLYMEPQDAAALASADPAIAYLLGLFRVMDVAGPTQHPCQFKVQGTWPEGQRYCIYGPYNPSENLAPPQMKQVKAQSRANTRVLRDYATFRTHHRINVADVCWPQIEASNVNQIIRMGPVAYIVAAKSQAQGTLTCKSPFYVPQEWEIYGQPTAEVHFTDWKDYYAKTDIHKVLDGTYTYKIAAFDVFGQISAFELATTSIKPAKLAPGEIQRPEITLSKLKRPATGKTEKYERVDIPLEVQRSGSKYVLRDYGRRDYLSFDYSFFWPLDARYVWDTNRKTGVPAVDFFRLLYLVDVPLSTDVLFDALVYQEEGATIKLEEIRPTTGTNQPHNAALFDLLQKLGAVDAAGQLLPPMVEAAFKGGSLIYQQAWDIIGVTALPSQQTLEIELIPASDDSRKAIKQLAFPWIWKFYKMINAPKLAGQLFWNTEATFGGSRVGWKYLTPFGVKVRPAAPFERKGRLVSSTTTPSASIGFPSDLVQAAGVEATKAVPAQEPPSGTQYGFVIRLDDDDPLAKANYDRFFFVPLDPGSNLVPGEYSKGSPPPGSDVEYPSSVKTLFSEDLILTFYAARSADDPDHPGKTIYRGEALPFNSKDPAHPDDLLLFPLATHQSWLVIVPTTILECNLPLGKFTKKGFGTDNYLTGTFTMGLEAVVSGKDSEVRTCLQATTASYKLSLSRYLEAPKLKVAGPDPPSFGRSAGRPDYHGVSLIRVRSIYDDDNLDLESELSGGQQYMLYTLPADRIVKEGMNKEGMNIEYALDAASGNVFRRNMVKLKKSLKTYHPTDPLGQSGLQELFSDFGQQVNTNPLDKAAFLDLAVELPGESRTVFLYAIKAYDATAKKESSQFTALSRPVYVEDATPPAAPILRDVDMVLREEPVGVTTVPKKYALNIEIIVSRRLMKNYANLSDEERADAAPFGYASPNDLASDLLGPCFPQIVAQYRLYLSTGDDSETLICPDDSDFTIIENSSAELGGTNMPNFNADKFQVRFDPDALKVQTSTVDPFGVCISAKVLFHESVNLDKLPSRLYFCLRAENYLGQLSALSFSPVAYREIG